MLTVVDDTLSIPELIDELIKHGDVSSVRMELEAECSKGNAYKVIVIKQ